MTEEGENADPQQRQSTRTFFLIMQRLPMEMQMIICNYSQDLNKEVVVSNLTEHSFKQLSRYFQK